MTRVIALAASVILLIFINLSFEEKGVYSQIKVPKDWPKPNYNFKDNPISEEGFQLGRQLFYDPKLSKDSTISCSSCHLQYTGFTHVDHNVSHGIKGRKGTRNAPALINLAWHNSYQWDGGVNHLDAHAINPIEQHVEMDNTLKNVLSYINASQGYRKLFFNAFNDSTATVATLLKAISQFNNSLISCNSKYDSVQNKQAIFTAQEKRGFDLFKSNCKSCHKPPLFRINAFKSNGLSIDTTFNDLGRYFVTNNPKDSLLFKVPTLRNVQYTFPYMHDGRYSHLRDVLDHYTDSISTGSNYLSKELKTRIVLSANDKKDLIAFLYCLSDKKFLFNPKFSFPRNK